MVDAWSPFGGLASRLNLIALILNMAIVEHAGIAIAYDVALRKYASQLARKRRADIDFHRLLPEGCPEIKKQIYANKGEMRRGEKECAREKERVID